MNLHNRMGQMMAERGDLRRMNIVERTVLWYRLERIGQPPEQPQYKTTPPPQPTRVIHHWVGFPNKKKPFKKSTSKGIEL